MTKKNAKKKPERDPTRKTKDNHKRQTHAHTIHHQPNTHTRLEREQEYTRERERENALVIYIYQEGLSHEKEKKDRPSI